jgi:hypothetical protein
MRLLIFVRFNHTDTHTHTNTHTEYTYKEDFI